MKDTRLLFFSVRSKAHEWRIRLKILVIDAQGGGIGKQMVTELLKSNINDLEITAVGTNTMATSAMLKAGANAAATGENAVIVGSRSADVIVGPIGIVIADSLLGEITPAMAVAVGQSKATKVLIPVNHCTNIVAGVSSIPMGALIQSAIDTIRDL